MNVSKSSDPERLNNICVANVRPSRVFLNMEVFMHDQEFSDIEILQHLGKRIPLFMTSHKKCLQADYNNGRRILCSQN